MPNEYLLATGGRPGQWVKLHNNDTGVDYGSSAVSDSNGMFAHNAPPDHYTTYEAPGLTIPDFGSTAWVATGNVDFIVPYTAGDAMVGSSFTARSSGPYAPNANPGQGVFAVGVATYGPSNGTDDTTGLNAH